MIGSPLFNFLRRDFISVAVAWIFTRTGWAAQRRHLLAAATVLPVTKHFPAKRRSGKSRRACVVKFLPGQTASRSAP
ncbi:MAG TPA: hypothetical protein VHH73_14940 [Verrucomicrobiae bacterium]|nr:hypothetical protein [Verrucomicrobiae bacterium]